MIHNINRRKFIELFGCGCCSLILPSCTTVPITKRKQLKLLPESTLNRQAAQIYENVKKKTKLSEDKKKLDEIMPQQKYSHSHWPVLSLVPKHLRALVECLEVIH